MALKRHLMLAVLVLAALMTVGTATASAHSGRGGKARAGGASVSTLVTRAATQLNVTRANLVAAIRASAVARINAAVAANDVTAADAAELREAVADNLSFAYRLSRVATVASNLNITEAALNNGFRAARRAIISARIDAALAAGQITADEAAQLRQALAAATLPGYKPVSLGSLGLRSGLRGFGRLR